MPEPFLHLLVADISVCDDRGVCGVCCPALRGNLYHDDSPKMACVDSTVDVAECCAYLPWGVDMKKSDYGFILLMLLVFALLVWPKTHQEFFGFSDRYYVLGGFMKFFLFATIGDIISYRIRQGNYRVPGLIRKAFVWGVLGIIIVLIFTIFSQGVSHLQESSILPFYGIAFFTAFFTSVFMNLLFAPTMMLVHRISDQVIEDRIDHQNSLVISLSRIDYVAFLKMLFKTIPFFWIPAHTITFLLPVEYRAFFAALLGIMLGLFLNLFKKQK